MFQDVNISPYKAMFNSKHAQWVEILYGAVFWFFLVYLAVIVGDKRNITSVS